ncbi:MAG: UDP-N-acetylglucosamine 1-carboxyvinyltransferase [Planctomycetes bacterium]|nr:UDP-N-acetylglucosamine 1-carboxyvinyltransferase [Planctomycetota bacterium]
MDILRIRGGLKLRGAIDVSGSKNAALPILCAGLLTNDTVTLRRVPKLRDIDNLLRILAELGVVSDRRADGSLFVKTESESNSVASYELVSTMRGSFTVLGPMLAKRRSARVSLPGGCVIGVRPVDLHLKGLRALGAEIRLEDGYVVAGAPRGLRGARVFLGAAAGSTVLGTANILMAATLAKGTTVIESAACEPEVEDLCRCLVSMGARIEGIGSPTLVIHGVDELHGATHEVIPDRIEAGTYILAGLLAGSEVEVRNCRPEHMGALFDRLADAGANFKLNDKSVACFGMHPLRATDVTTYPHPGFPTDLQAQWMTAMSIADGVSMITERIFQDRYLHAAELMRMGAQIRRDGPCCIVRGVSQLSGAPVMASDLRASAALVVAGLVAKGETIVRRVYHIDRGYEEIEKKLSAIGADIRRETEHAVTGVEAAVES